MIFRTRSVYNDLEAKQEKKGLCIHTPPFIQAVVPHSKMEKRSEIKIDGWKSRTI